MFDDEKEASNQGDSQEQSGSSSMPRHEWVEEGGKVPDRDKQERLRD